MPRYRLTIEYAGTRYSGWQVQKNARTVQGEVLRAVREATGVAAPEMQGSGRTDAGVHATQTNITEVSVPLSALGFVNTGTCPATIPTAVYFDNGIVDPDDNVPDAGTFNINCGLPTAVTLSSLQAQPTTSPVLPVALVGVSAVVLISVVFLTRRGRRKAV